MSLPCNTSSHRTRVHANFTPGPKAINLRQVHRIPASKLEATQPHRLEKKADRAAAILPLIFGSALIAGIVGLVKVLP